MPMLKQVPLLQHLCLASIAENLPKHSLVYSSPKTKSEELWYSMFQRNFSNDLMEFLIKRKSNFGCDEEVVLTQMQMLFNAWLEHDEIAKRCLEFVINSHITTLLPQSESFKLSAEPALALMKNCKKITDFNLHMFKIEDQRYFHLVPHSLRNVVRIDISHTHCGDKTLSAIWRYCTHLTHLNLNDNRVTDEGIKMICRNYCTDEANGSKFPDYCKNPVECSLTSKLRQLNITGNNISYLGVIWILEHARSLQKVIYLYGTYTETTAQGEFQSDYDTSIPEALLRFSRRINISNPELNLNSLEFGEDETSRSLLGNAISLCPKLKKVSILVSFNRHEFSLLTNCANLCSLTLNNIDESVFESSEFQNFLFLRGHQLKTLKLFTSIHTRYYLHSIHFSTSSIINIMSLCPKLEKLILESIQISPSTENMQSSYEASTKRIKIVHSMEELKTLTFASISGCKSSIARLLSDIISISGNLQNLCIIDSIVDYETLSSFVSGQTICNVRKLCIQTDSVPYEFIWNMITERNELKTLEIVRCDNLVKVMEMKKYVQEKNLDLNIIVV